MAIKESRIDTFSFTTTNQASIATNGCHRQTSKVNQLLENNPKPVETHRPTLMTTSSSPSSNLHYDNISNPRISGFFSLKEIRKHFDGSALTSEQPAHIN
ncbi:unnamed protein product [Brugia pahangi]|uniref:Ovule protein n=1 Tax=Brugia pahangi TaxID=6280 RepID=A0A0N4TVP1_BRUPA|nr:unnamed protein product [Brugia pahangi]